MANNKLTNCPVCQAEIAKNAKTCPSCGAKMKKPIFKKWWFWVIIIIVLIGIGASGGNDSTDNPQVSVDNATTETTDTTADAEVTEPEAPAEDFSLVGDCTTEDDGFAFYISGTLQNNTDKTYSYAQITFNLYDASGSQIGTALANVNNLEANGSWKFKAMGMGENGDVATYKYMGVDAF